MPRTTTQPHTTTIVVRGQDKFYYTYILESLKDHKRYVGYTSDLRKRLKEHNDGKSFSTKPRLPFRLIYYEACLNKEDAKRRERFFKQTKGRISISKRLKLYYIFKPS